MLVIDIKTKGESYPISFIWRGNAEESRSLYEQIEDVSVRECCDANDMAAQVIKRDRRIPVFLALLMIFATSYVVALRRPGFERKGHRVAFFAGARCAGGRHDIDASIRATELCRIDEDMPLCDRDLAARGACGQPKIHRDRAGDKQLTPLIS